MSIASDLERQMLDLINAERAAYGLNALTLELNLNESAEIHSEWMLETDTFSHIGNGGTMAGDRMADAGFDFSGSWTWGENIGWQSERGDAGYADDVIDLHNSLMASPGHRANILNPLYELVGIGIEMGEYDGWTAVMVTQNFASTDGTVELDESASEATQTPGPAPEPDPVPQEPTATDVANGLPVVQVDDIVLAKVKGERQTKLQKHLDVTDADGDAIAWFELRDTEGRNNFKIKGEGRIDASGGYRVDAADLDLVRVVVNKKPGETTLSVRAFDGEDVGLWDDFTLTTLSASEWNDLA